MEIIRCSKGHYYDSTRSCCPVCEEENTAAYGSPARKAEAVGPTEPVRKAEPIGVTQPISRIEPIGVTQPVGRTEPFGTTESVRASELIEEAEPAQGAASEWESERNFEAVTGWLVCVYGADKGKDYRLHLGNNFVGRGEEMDVRIENDPCIREEKEAVIGYDDLENTFYFAPGYGRNILRVNEKMIISTVELSPYDTITIGKSRFLFVPLCGAQFQWKEVK